MSLSGEVKALTFDVFGTVVNWREGIAREAGELFRARGLTVDGHAFADAWRARYQPAMEAVRPAGGPGRGSTTCIARTCSACSTSWASRA